MNFHSPICLTLNLGDNFHEVVLENKEEIVKKFKEVKALPEIEKIEDSIKLGQLFIDYKLLRALERDPRVESELKKKYPKFLLPARPQFNKFTDKGFYTWQIEKPRGKLAFLLFMGIMLVIVFMLFNIWPLWIKIGLWYFSFYTLIVLVCFLI